MSTGKRVRVIDLVDTQAGGDVSRVVLGGVGPLPGDTVLDQARGLTTTLPDGSTIEFDLVFSGGFYAVIRAEPLGHRLTPDEGPALAALAHTFVTATREQHHFTHPLMGDIGPQSFVHFAGPVVAKSDGRYESRSVTYVHPGVICRSPTGTGTSARLALVVDDGTLAPGERLETISLRGSRFIGTVPGVTTVGEQQALRSTITGRAWTLAHSKVVVDLDDPLIEDQGLSRLLTDDYIRP